MGRMAYKYIFMKHAYFTIIIATLLVAYCQRTKSSQVQFHSNRSEISDFISYSQAISGTDVSIEMEAIQGGSFLMGRPVDDDGTARHEGPQKKVVVNDFWMSTHVITWDLYDLFVNESIDRIEEELSPEVLEAFGIGTDAFAFPSPPYSDDTFGMGEGRTGYPAISMTHFAAIEFAKWLTAKTGNFYRLPTEAEWEYACRAGSETIYAHGDDSEELDTYEWYRDNSERSYQKAGLKKPNAFGLYDMQGNVAEWTMDQYVTDYHECLEGEVAKNPVFLPDQLYPRAVRGGSWRDEAADIRCTSRRGSSGEWSRSDPQIPRSMWWHTNAPFVGFRVVRPGITPNPTEIEKYWIEPILDF